MAFFRESNLYYSNIFRLQTSLIITACCFVISFHRITNFRDKIIQPEGGRYHVPLKSLVNLSYIRSLPPETSLQIEITINQNGKELFETKKDAAGNDPDPGYINITKVPELHIETIDQTSTHQLNFETIFNEQGQYLLWHGMSWNTMQTEIATGKSEIRL